MRKIMTTLKVLQVKNLKQPLGLSYKSYRLNPFNPLSYLVIPIALVIGVLMFGFVGIRNEVDWKNPFKWTR